VSGRSPATYACASPASASHRFSSGTTSHSFMTCPVRRGSKRVPSPAATSSSTRALASLATSPCSISMAKIFAPALSARWPRPQPGSTETPRRPAKASTTRANRGSSSAAGTTFARLGIVHPVGRTARRASSSTAGWKRTRS
jgi:hypothetical protein